MVADLLREKLVLRSHVFISFSQNRIKWFLEPVHAIGVLSDSINRAIYQSEGRLALTGSSSLLQQLVVGHLLATALKDVEWLT